MGGLQRGERCHLRGQKLYAEANPSRPFGMLATFYKRRLVELSYMLSSTSFDSLSLTLASKCGKASHATYDGAGNMVSIEWVDRVASLDLQFVPIFPAIAKGNFLCIRKGQESNALRIRTRFNTMPSSDP